MFRHGRIAVWFCTILATASTGCSTMNNTEKGGLIGAGVGAGLGTAIGAATGNPKTGAVAGTLLGGGLGALAGHNADKRDEVRAEVRQASADQVAAEASRPAQGGLIDVVTMVQQNVSADVIINQIRSTGSTFNLSTKDIEYLSANNVPPQVIRTMQDSRQRAYGPPLRERIIVREAPVYIERPIYYAPPPPAFGFQYSHVRVR